MKRTLVITFLTFTFGLSCLAQQSVLRLMNTRNQKTSYYQEGTKVNLKTANKTYKGSFKIVSDSSILINSDTILLDDIKNLKTKTGSDIMRGSLYFLGGTGLTIGLLYAKSEVVNESDSDDDPIAKAFNFSATLTAIGALAGLEMMFTGDSHKSGKWEYKIVKALPVDDIKIK